MEERIRNNCPNGPAADRIRHFFRDGVETEPGATRPGGRIVRGAAWFTTSPAELIRAAQVRESSRTRALSADRKPVVVRRVSDRVIRPVRGKYT